MKKMERTPIVAWKDLPFFAVIALLAATTVTKLFELRYTHPVEGFERVEALARQIQIPEDASVDLEKRSPSKVFPDQKESDLICPEVNRPYEVFLSQNQFRICCPDEGNHLGIGHPISCRTEKGWELRLVSREEVWEDPSWNFEKSGFGMVILNRKPDVSYFLFVLGVASLSLTFFIFLSQFLLRRMNRPGIFLLLKLGTAISGLMVFLFLYELVYLSAVDYEIRVLESGRVLTHLKIGNWTLEERVLKVPEIIAVGQKNGVYLAYLDDMNVNELKFLRIPMKNEKTALTLGSLIQERVLEYRSKLTPPSKRAIRGARGAYSK